jgi:hypothetical protein
MLYLVTGEWVEDPTASGSSKSRSAFKNGRRQKDGWSFRWSEKGSCDN